jgi:hypothetical protein
MEAKHTPGTNIVHPHFERVMEHGPDLIILFRFGHYVRPDAAAEAAFERIQAAVKAIDKSDYELVRKWGGRAVVYTMVGHSENPEITDEDIRRCRDAALAAYPGWHYVASWRNSMHDISGVSVRIAKDFGGTT